MGVYLERVNDVSELKNLNKTELVGLAEELRKHIIECVSKTGGHLASNLGVVDLTIALHYVFNSPVDKLIWDVGHQTYTHKILTERKDKFDTLRQYNGLSGFPKKAESCHDIFETGHTSTSISAASGMAEARDILGEKHEVIAIIGDGALTGGQAYEALNNIGSKDTNVIVILNDNQMSISPNTGGISNYLNKIRTSILTSDFKLNVEKWIESIPKVGKYMKKTVELAQGSLESLIIPGKLFEDMGVTYLGPVDGHNIQEMIDIFEKVKKLKGPKLIHVKTIKGKGYGIAEEAPCKFHGVGAFDIDTGKATASSSGTTYSQVFGSKLLELAEKNDKIVAITAAMPEGTKLEKFAEKYPNRFFDVGIAEQHAVTFAAGIATAGLKPFFAVYSTFLQRGYDQMIHDVCMQKLPVVFCIDRAGIVGEDGETHQGVFDLSYLSTIPNMTIMVPKDKNEFEEMLEFAADFNGPIAIRYPRGQAGISSNISPKIEYGKWETMIKGENIVIIATGKMVSKAVDIAEKLKENNVQAELVNARFVSPIDHEMLLELGNKFKKVYVIEDNIEHGGLGTKVIDFYNENKLLKDIEVTKLAFPVTFIEHGKPEELYNKYGLDVETIAGKIINDRTGILSNIVNEKK
ncbi:MAG TPA: 1-deoxy-D-xylulose-5-phosphate synthase [Clostridiales bacterium]|nr:MAG: 1-deoxy-D-xylulose-5-phosphate synthase [Clostridiales bacterium GWD2_32_19]HCC07148.1 1-deoxy-D-xylulose-5-phosphate synthase [Clostridiales bacterium]